MTVLSQFIKTSSVTHKTLEMIYSHKWESKQLHEQYKSQFALVY